MRSSLIVLSFAVVLSLVSSSPAQEAASKPTGKIADTIGWRQNWTGSFPQATPPTVWGRTLKDSVVKGLRSQGTKPKGDTLTDIAAPMSDGLLLTYLAVGPFDPKVAGKGLEEEFIAKEGDLRPDEGQAVGEMQWKVLTYDRADYPLNDQAPVPLYKALGKVKPGQVGYAHAYVFSDRGGKVDLMIDHTDACKAWLNGSVIYNQPKWAMGFGWWGPMSSGKLNYGERNRSPRVSVELKKGWNSLLIKLTSMQMEWGGGFSVLPRFIDAGPGAYEDKNILWAAPLPDRSNANPIVVGDKVFVVAEQNELICLDKKTGKQLWNRYNDHLSATPKEEIEKNESLKEAQKLLDQLYQESDFGKRYILQRQMRELLVKADKAKFEMVMESHPAGHWFSTGFTTPAPCSDGTFVYVWMTHGVAACYDLDGKRQWIKRIDELVKSPDDKDGPYFYPQGSVLIGGKFIFWDKDVFALDAKTGEIAWRKPKLALGIGAMPATLGGTEVLLTSMDVIRASDGQVLWASLTRINLGMGGSTFADDLLCVQEAGLSVSAYNLAGASGEPFKAAAKQVGCGLKEMNYCVGDDYSKKGTWRDQWIFAAPLYVDGLVYFVDAFARLFVADVKTGKCVYRQQLPLTPLVNVRSVGLAASLALGGKNIYVFDNQGGCVVFEPGPVYKQVSVNRIETLMPRTHTGENWQEMSTMSQPTFDGGRIYIRGEAFLYCVGEK